MLNIFRHILPLSLRVRFLLATAAVVMVLSLAYGLVALVGYSVSFDKTTFRLLRGESNLFYTLSSWKDGKLQVDLPDNISIQSPTMALIYDEHGKLLWMQRNVPDVVQQIQKEWLTGNGFHELEADYATSSALLDNDKDRLAQLKDIFV
ncbi:two-component system sensor histidine kinase PhoQ, partial [Klebsiella sp. Ap-873]|nr:two-component system sensor histidine kinase PhoQ [Klebsiella sp. Ap-873]